MSNTPPDSESRPQYYRTVVAHFEGPDGEPPPGVRVVEPATDTRQALRGNLYAIVDLVGDSPERVQLAERLLSAIQRTYFTRGGSQSQVLTEAVRQARLRVFEYNQGHPDRPLKLGVICAGLVKSRLMIAHSGPGVAFITSRNQIERYPTDVVTFDMESPLDRTMSREIYRQTVGERTALFVGTSRWLDMVPVRLIAGTVAHLTIENCGDAASGLLAESRRPDLPGLLLVIERTDTPPPAVSRSRVPLRPAQKRPPFLGAIGLPVAVNAPPPKQAIPAAGRADSASTPSAAERTLLETDDADAALVSEPPTVAEMAMIRSDEAEALPDGAFSEEELPGAAAAAEASVPISVVQETRSTGPTTVDKVAAGVTAGSLALYARSRELLGGMLPESRTRADAGGAFFEDAAVDAPDAGSNTAATATSSFYSDVTAQVNAAMVEGARPFEPPPPASGSRARIFIALAVLILLLAPVVVFAVEQKRAPIDTVNGENTLQIAENALDNAWRALNNGDEAIAREMFLKAQENVDLATTLLGPSERSDELLAEIDLGLGEVMKSHYLYQLFDPLLRFPPDAEPSRVLVAGDHIFVLDRGRQQIDRYEMDALHEFVPDPAPETIMREGMNVDGAAISSMVDMTWQPIITGYEERPKLVVLDRNKQLFSYDLRVDGVQPMVIGEPAVLQNPTQLELFLGRTYLADEGARQIFRYDPGGLDETPAGWFPDDARPYMSGLLAMAIDGDIWLLNSEGTLVRYNGGEQVPFSLDRGAVRADEPVDMVLGSQADSSIFIADAAQDRILVFDKDGAYRYQLVAAEGEPLADLRGLYLDEIDDKIYILTQNALYQHPLPE